MRRIAGLVFAFVLAYAAAVGGWQLARAQIGLGNIPFAVGFTYKGPIDATTTALACYSVRACTSAIAGSATVIVNLRRSSDSEKCDFGTTASGGIGLSKNCTGSDNGETPTTFANGGTLFVAIWYDQSGNNYYLAQTTTGDQPTFTLSCIGSLPCVTFGGTGFYMLSSTIATDAQPVTSALVAERNSHFTTYGEPFGNNNGSNISITYNDAANGIVLYSGTLSSAVTVADSTLHSMSFVWNGSSSIANIDGTETTGLSVGTGGTSTYAIMGASASQGFYGFSAEGIIWASGLSSTNRTNYCHNARLYFGTGGSC